MDVFCFLFFDIAIRYSVSMIFFSFESVKSETSILWVFSLGPCLNKFSEAGLLA